MSHAYALLLAECRPTGRRERFPTAGDKQFIY